MCIRDSYKVCWNPHFYGTFLVLLIYNYLSRAMAGQKGSGGTHGAGFTRYAKEHSPAHAFSPVTLPRKVPLRIGELSLAKPVIRPFLPIQASCGHKFGLPR